MDVTTDVWSACNPVCRQPEYLVLLVSLGFEMSDRIRLRRLTIPRILEVPVVGGKGRHRSETYCLTSCSVVELEGNSSHSTTVVCNQILTEEAEQGKKSIADYLMDKWCEIDDCIITVAPKSYVYWSTQTLNTLD